MKGSTFAAAAAMAGSAAAARLHHRHAGAHELFRKDEGSMCIPECTTIYSTFYGEPTLHLSPAPSSTPPVAVAESSPAPTEPVAVAPTPTPVTVTEPGTYTIPGTTVTLTEPTTVLGVTTTHLPPGTHTIGGVTTVVPGPTTVTVPVAVVTPGTDNIPTSIISSTIYVCPSAGTYTVGPITTAVPTEGDVEYPFPTEYPAGTYTRPEVVTTITLQSTVFYCPYTSSGAVEPTPAPVEPTPEPVAPTTTAAPVVTDEPVVSIPAVVSSIVSSIVAPPASSVASSTPAASTTPKAPVSGGLGGGSWFAMTYTPYTSEKVSACKDKDTIRSDIQEIANAGFLGVRVYSTECDTLPNVGDAVAEFGLKLILGVFVKDDGCTYETETIKTQVDAMVAWADWTNVVSLVVGNEARLSGKCSTDQLATLFTTVKEKTQAAGYTGGYTVAETTNVWQDTSFSGVMCDLVDVTGGNIHPYFNAETSPENAGTFVKGQLDILDAICPGKTSFNLECGWPKAGNPNGLAVPGVAEQATALASIVAECGSRTVFFSYGDDEWKEPGDCGCENSWGCGSLFEAGSIAAARI